MKRRVLLVEDQHEFIPRMILGAYEDLEIVVAQRGDKAIELFATGDFDGVVLDLRLPVVDGFGVLHVIKKMRPKTPVVVLSAYDDKKQRDRAARLGADAFFVKPPDYRKVHQKLIELIAISRRDKLTTTQFDDGDTAILAKHRRLLKLREEAARKGISTPPEILIEIEDLEDELGMTGR